MTPAARAGAIKNLLEIKHMLVRIYWTIWAMFLFIGALLFVSGNFTMFAAVAMGFFAFGLTFMGMISVLPGMVTHPAPERSAAPDPIVAPVRQTSTAKAFGVLKSA